MLSRNTNVCACGDNSGSSNGEGAKALTSDDGSRTLTIAFISVFTVGNYRFMMLQRETPDGSAFLLIAGLQCLTCSSPTCLALGVNAQRSIIGDTHSLVSLSLTAECVSLTSFLASCVAVPRSRSSLLLTGRIAPVLPHSSPYSRLATTIVMMLQLNRSALSGYCVDSA